MVDTISRKVRAAGVGRGVAVHNFVLFIISVSGEGADIESTKRNIDLRRDKFAETLQETFSIKKEDIFKVNDLSVYHKNNSSSFSKNYSYEDNVPLSMFGSGSIEIKVRKLETVEDINMLLSEIEWAAFLISFNCCTAEWLQKLEKDAFGLAFKDAKSKAEHFAGLSGAELGAVLLLDSAESDDGVSLFEEISAVQGKTNNFDIYSLNECELILTDDFKFNERIIVDFELL